MDCDDNDSQSQNFNLAGEGSTKFPPALLPYALPKFDFDDSLQGHLRFDSLVEAEVFLGIESNEDNQWIEDFSRGNSAIGFSSSGTEACSISRHRNVWSEAASSESVEILLKSVGQEEIYTEKGIIKELEASDDLGCLVEKMEPSLKGDNNILSKTGDAMDIRPSLESSELRVNSCGMKDAAREKDASEENSEAYHTSHTNEASFDGHSSGLEPDGVSGKESSSTMAEGSPFTVAHCDDKSRAKSDIVEDESLDNWVGDFSASDIPVDENVDSGQNNILSHVEMNRQEVSTQSDSKIDKRTGGMQTACCEKGAEHHFLNEEVQIGGQDSDRNGVEAVVCNLEKTLCPDSKADHAFKGDPGKMSVVGETSPQTLKGDGESLVVECSKDLCSPMPSEKAKESGIAAVSCDMRMIGNCHLNLSQESSLALKSGIHVGIVTEKGKANAGICAILEPHVDHVPQIRCSDQEDNVLDSSPDITEKSSVSKSEVPLSAADKDDDSKSDNAGDSKIQGKEISSLNVSHSSSELLREPKATGIVTDISGSCRGDRSSESLVSSTTPSDIEPKCEQEPKHEENRVDRQEDGSKHGNDLLVNEEESIKLETNAIIEGEEDCKCNSTYQCSTSPVLAESDADNVLVPKSKSEAGNELVRFTHSDKDTTAAEVSLDVTTTVVSSEVTNGLGSVSNAGKVATGDSEGKESHETVNQSLLVVVTESQMIHHEVVATKAVQDCEKKMEVTPMLFDSAANTNNDSTEAIDPVGKQEEATSEKCIEKELKDLEENPSNVDVVLQPLTSKPEDSCHNTAQKEQKDTGANFASGDKDIGETVVQHNTGDSLRANGQSANPVSVSECDVKVQESGGSGSDADFKKSASGSFTVTESSGQNQTAEKEKEAKCYTDQHSEACSPSADLSRTEPAKNWSVSTPASIILPAVEESPSSSGLKQMEFKSAHDISHGIPLKSDADMQGGPRGTSERKIRRSSGKAARKENAKKGNSRDESTPVKQVGQGKKGNNVSLSPSGICTPMQHTMVQNFGNVDCGSSKLFGLLATSSLPDLNTLVSPSARLPQPFSDMQQVQLRAQIFVYGALIQGTVPDEACMISAFGGPDGGRITWESAWRASMKRLQDQKSHSINPETPLQSNSGAGISDQKSKLSASQNKVICTPIDRAGGKNTPTTVINPMIPLSSPLWNIPTPSCDALQAIGMPRGAVLDYKHPISQLHPYQTPPMRNFVGHNPLISQPPIRGSWVVPPQISSADSSIRSTAFVRTEKVQLTPVKESSSQHASGTMHVSPGSVAQSGVPTNMFSGTSSLVDSMKVVTSAVQQTESKPRKRKKIATSEDPGGHGGISKISIEPVSLPAVSSHPSISVGTASPSGLVYKDTIEKFALAGSTTPSFSVDHTKKLSLTCLTSEKKANMSEEINDKVKEAREQAEGAAAFAASTISHCQEVWSQLYNQRSSGLVPDVESTLASAVSAISAAASVAKAAAEAAKVASNAALQAKLMAEGALELGGYGNSDRSNVVSLSDSVNRGKASPASVLKGDTGMPSSNSIIIAAKEAARKRIEAATTASRQAENMDAIVKAAELAAEAVSQAGIIVSMGNPVSLSELVKAGPEGFWKALLPPVTGANNNDGRHEQVISDGALKAPSTSGELSKERTMDDKCASREIVGHANKEDGTLAPLTTSEKDSNRAKGRKVSEVAKTTGVVPGSENAPRASFVIQKEDKNTGSTSVGSSITEGSLVEVLKDGGGLKTAWYQASVLDLQGGKAFVCYNELKSDEGSECLKEWVSINGEDEVPRIRIARPVVATDFGGTRKRRRAAMGDYNWSVGDKVDAWIQDSWCEGVVKEKSKKDNTMFTVQLTGLGQAFEVKAWHIRPSLIWKEGQWIEWSRSRASERPSHESDSPQQKRAKMGTSVVDGKNEMSKDTNVLELGKSDDIRLLDLATNQKTFNIGKSTRDENKDRPLRTLRTNLQKEGSRVIFGVPKPGKKRKFMEVSKHYTDHGTKSGEANESVKFAKYLMPQKSGSRGSKATAKGDLKDKQGSESKPRIPKPGKLQNVSSRTISQRGKVSVSGVPEPVGGSTTEQNDSMRESTSKMENASEGAADEPILFSSVAPSSGAPISRKTSSSNRIGRANKGKLAPAGAKLTKVEEDKVSDSNQTRATSEIVEPRRSNRKIQPTSRLLEGLQSSLFISKIPSVSHDKGHRSQNRNASRGSSHG